LANALYLSAQLFIMQTPSFESTLPWTLEIARWLAAASTGLVLFNAALHLFHHEQIGLLLRHRKNHSIVCGLGRRGIVIAEKLYAAGIPVVAIEKNPEPDLEERLHKMGIPLITGDATRKEILLEARTEYADSLFTFCPDDTINISIALQAHNLNCFTGTTRKCFIHINDAELRNALQNNFQEKSPESKQSLQFIDAYGPEAISLLVHGLPLDHDGISPSDTRTVHLIILGFGCMGRTIAVKAAQLGQFANRKKLRISVIDRNAMANQSALLFHHPYILDEADFSFYQQEVLSSDTRNQLEKWCNEPGMVVSVVICFDNSSIVYDSVFNLLPVLNKKNVRVAIRVNEPESFAFLLKGAGINKYHDLHILPFGMEKSLETLAEPYKNETERFAIDIHQAYDELVNKGSVKESGKSHRSEKSKKLNAWNNLTEDLKESNRQQAVHMYFKLRACGFEIADLKDPRPAIEKFETGIFDALAIMEHDRWVAERKVNNWKYGKPSDKPNRINENIVDWDKLSPDIQKYDYEAVALIPRLLRKVGKKMVEKNHVKK
jgi:hypothetical protein